MSLFSSLTNRIFAASALLVVISISVAVVRVNVSVTDRAEADLRAGLDEAAAVVDEFRRTQFDHFVREGRLIADLPKFKAAVALDDPPTVQPIAEDYQQRIQADLFIVMSRGGRVIARAGRIRPAEADALAMMTSRPPGRDATWFWPYGEGVLQVAALPITIEPGPELLGTLIVGFGLDQSVAERIRRLTSSHIALVAGAHIVATTLPDARTANLTVDAGRVGPFDVRIAGDEYIARAQPLGGGGEAAPVVVVLRSRTEHLRFLGRLHREIAVTGLAAILVATLLGYLVARTVTRPLRAITATMREIAVTGDLARAIPPTGRWDDEDARLLATSFRQLTMALDTFQREASQRERLSSLGRLSTVVAHEVRNPLMIIKTALRTLRRSPSPEATAAAAANIEEEVTRLNRVVSGVLDFARPIRFDLAPADLVEVTTDAARAAAAAPDAEPISIEVSADIDASEPRAPIVTDAERLRAVLVNLFANAQVALSEQAAAGGSRGAKSIVACVKPSGGGWRLEVADTGAGISPQDLPRIFDPFFTTRRTGSGLGLAIARNVIEGLGGVIAVESRPSYGTTVTIDLPSRPPAARSALPGIDGKTPA